MPSGIPPSPSQVAKHTPFPSGQRYKCSWYPILVHTGKWYPVYTGSFGSEWTTYKDGWHRYTYTRTLGAGATTAGMGVRVGLNASQGSFLVDAFQVENKSYATPYADGSLGNGHSWSGTAHASTSSRTQAGLYYDFGDTAKIDKTQGTVSFLGIPFSSIGSS